MDHDNYKNFIKVYQYAHKLKRNGKTPAEIKRELMHQGIDEKTSETIALNIERYNNAIKKKAGEDNILYGGAWVTGGIIISLITYNAGAKNIICYTIAWGVALFGAGKLIRGLIQRW